MSSISLTIKEKAIESGFDLVGISKAWIPAIDKENIEYWVKNKLYGKMDWFPKNQNLRLYFENIGFSSVSAIVVASFYLDKEYYDVFKRFSFRLSRYAVGKDYHKILRQKAKGLLSYLKTTFPNQKFRQSVDTLPISEKVLAREAGIGWMGKNTNIIHPKKGSYFFLSVVLTDLPLEYDDPMKDRCGSCRACMDACPTRALYEPYKIDAGRCISHHTIEDKSLEFSQDAKLALSSWIYGCDICQEVCPFNKVASKNQNNLTKRKEFHVKDYFHNTLETDFLSLNQKEFEEFVRDSAMNRISYLQFKRNVDAYYHWKKTSHR
ncbi:MAG: tRNA epoxyqueuosine(34) reductase QueG [Leptospiraceae bacterium]|nr:tRNA epoxyqueuosine(34) reductase QueG [Leptospiraceae bacterium]MCP5495805.1 tRNA epoxyqueuosine(34) reductase QueG [Leptospiraceae bacterium]